MKVKMRRVVAPCRVLGRGSVQFPLDGKPCLTEYQVLGHTRSAQHNWVTTVKLRPHTGAQDGWFPLSQAVRFDRLLSKFVVALGGSS